MGHSLIDIFKLVKISHTLFALPFTLASFVLASHQVGFSLVTLLLVIAAMFFMRTTAMCFNRYVDADIDRKNPRTQNREIPQGVMSKNIVLIYVIFFSFLFFVSAFLINDLAFKLSPIAWIVCLGYSLCKRFTSLSHFVLGLALGLSPIGAWVAVTGSISWTSILMGAVVVLWTAGFDILYACMDYDFDVKEGLHSVPATFGIGRSLLIAKFLHLVMIVFWALMILKGGYGWPLWSVLGFSFLLIFLEHCLVKLDDLKRMNLVFFKLNVVISFSMLLGCSLEVVL